MTFQETSPHIEVNGLTRRWFSDPAFDLIVWITVEGHIQCFQLCYDKSEQEWALVWHLHQGFSHGRVDAGGDEPERDLSPVLDWGGRCPTRRILGEFAIHSEGMEPHIRTFVLAKIQTHFEAQSATTALGCPPDSPERL